MTRRGQLFAAAVLVAACASLQFEETTAQAVDPCGDFVATGLHRPRHLRTPGYPHRNYPPMVHCIVVLAAPPNHTIALYLGVDGLFEVEPPYAGGLEPGNSNHCPSDFVEVRDGRYGFSPLVGRFCGLEPPRRQPVRAASGHMWLRFRSDALLEYKGFEARYEYKQKNGSAAVPIRCHFDYTYERTGSNYGIFDTDEMKAFHAPIMNDSDSAECTWHISVQSNMHVQIYVEEFALGEPNDCGVNFVEIYSPTTAATPLRKHCGASAPDVRTGGHSAHVRVVATVAAMRRLAVRLRYAAYEPAESRRWF